MEGSQKVVCPSNKIASVMIVCSDSSSMFAGGLKLSRPPTGPAFSVLPTRLLCLFWLRRSVVSFKRSAFFTSRPFKRSAFFTSFKRSAFFTRSSRPCCPPPQTWSCSANRRLCLVCRGAGHSLSPVSFLSLRPPEGGQLFPCSRREVQSAGDVEFFCASIKCLFEEQDGFSVGISAT